MKSDEILIKTFDQVKNDNFDQVKFDQVIVCRDNKSILRLLLHDDSFHKNGFEHLLLFFDQQKEKS
jgi:hypothetical protein